MPHTKHTYQTQAPTFSNSRGKKGSYNFDISNTSEFAPLGASKVEASS